VNRRAGELVVAPSLHCPTISAPISPTFSLKQANFNDHVDSMCIPACLRSTSLRADNEV
jgi:hypothetical protein